MIRLQGVSKTFHADSGSVEAVRGVSLSVQRGEIFGIIGASGAGKSTLVRCMNLLEVPTAGSVTVDGACLTGMEERQLRDCRKRIGMIFQHFNLLKARTVFDNIAYPLSRSGQTKQQTAERVRELLRLVDMSDKENAYPSQLSGGQKQRVAIARALANDPHVLLCDEATSALDPQTTHSILQLIKKLSVQLDLTVVIITHEMTVVKEICDKVAIMDGGLIVEQGDVFDIFANPQHAVTKEFINTTSNLSRIFDLIEERSPLVAIGQDEVILRLTYVQKNVSEPLVSAVSRNFGVDLNIIFSNIEIIKGVPLGGIVAIASGGRRNIGEAIRFLHEKNVGVEVILDGRVAVGVVPECHEQAGSAVALS